MINTIDIRGGTVLLCRFIGYGWTPVARFDGDRWVGGSQGVTRADLRHVPIAPAFLRLYPPPPGWTSGGWRRRLRRGCVHRGAA